MSEVRDVSDVSVVNRRRSTLIAAAFSIAFFGVLWITAPSMGITRDESYYFKAAEEYGRWWDVLFSARFFDAFKDDEIKRHFSYNTEHPALVKLALGLGHRFWHDLLGLKSSVQAYRTTGFFFAALSVFATFLLGRAIFSAKVGFIAAALLAALPRYFYDAHLACFDVPMTAMWALGLWSFWRALRAPAPRRWRTAALAGVLFGLALATKLNAFFLPPLYVLAWLWAAPKGTIWRWSPGPSGGRDWVLPAIPPALLVPALLGPIVFFVHWPYLWNAPFTRVAAYIAFHLHHEHYPISYFHQLLAKPPFPIGFSFVMSALTLPLPFLLLGAGGLLAATARMFRRRSAADCLLVSATLLPLVMLSLPSTPIFGGVKHWFNAMPTLAVLAAQAIVLGMDAAGAWISSRTWRPWAASLVAGVALLPGVLGIGASHPYGIGFYNEVAGGFRGGAELGMQRVFWGAAADGLLPFLRDLPPSSQVFFNRSTYDAWRMHRKEGNIRDDVYYANDAKGAAAAGFNFLQPEHAERLGEIWSSLGTRPIAGIYVDNVPLAEVYIRGRSDRPPE